MGRLPIAVMRLFAIQSGMGGNNPYLGTPTTPRSQKTFKITFANLSKTITVQPESPTHGTGQPGSILDIALANGIDIDHACGGVAACSTCHVYVKEGLNTCSRASEAENDMLDLAPDLKPNSRLSCQCVPNGDSDITIEIPEWNRNRAREGTS